MSRTALLTVSIGPVHAFIATARRVADQWSASQLLSAIAARGIETVLAQGGRLLFPYVADLPVPEGLPNRFVCRVPLERVEDIARSVEGELRSRWAGWVRAAAHFWQAELGLSLGGQVSTEQAEGFLEISWSWVPEAPDYAAAMREGARSLNAWRRFRPFVQTREMGQKCALCGERAALPDGRRQGMAAAWKEAYKAAAARGCGAYLREDQSRLCLVCFTKRLYPWLEHRHRRARFGDFERIGLGGQAELRELERRAKDVEGEELDSAASGTPYFALVSMDGDRVGRILGWSSERIPSGNVEGFHRELSKILTGFASSLRTEDSALLRLDDLLPYLSEPPERPAYLVYAGGEDVLFYCHPRDAFALAQAVRELYRERMQPLGAFLDAQYLEQLTISAGILFAHARRPAGLSFRDVQHLLDHKAKHEAGRDAVALRLDKRSGPAVEVAFGWDTEFPQKLVDLSSALRDRRLASRTSYRFRDEEEILGPVFRKVAAEHADTEAANLWRGWLTRRLAVSGEVEEKNLKPLVEELVAFLAQGHPEALRIARFLGREVKLPNDPPEASLEEAS